MLVTAVTDLKEFQRFEQKSLVREKNVFIWILNNCQKHWNRAIV